MKRDCPNRGSGGACHTCGEEGHFSRECPSRSERGTACHNCKEEGHFARDCPKAGEIDESRLALVVEQ